MAPSLLELFSYTGRWLSQILSVGTGSISASFGDIIAPYEALSGPPACRIDGPMSCHNNTPVAEIHVASYIPEVECSSPNSGTSKFTQMAPRRTGHSTGFGNNNRPDLCDDTYDQYCHMTPQYTNITEVLNHHGHQDLVEFMNRYWLASYGPNSQLWELEFNKHATCINTLAPSCYGPSYQPGMEVVDYFYRAIALFRTLDTYHALEEFNILPHLRKHYPLADVQKVLEEYSGGKVVLRCGGRRDVLHQVWYQYFIQGSLQTGEFVPAKALGNQGDPGNCAPWIKYLPKKHEGGP